MDDQERGRWTRLVAVFEASDLTQREFASERGISFSKLRNWIYRFRKESRPLVAEGTEHSRQGPEQPSGAEGSRLVPARNARRATSGAVLHGESRTHRRRTCDRRAPRASSSSMSSPGSDGWLSGGHTARSPKVLASRGIEQMEGASNVIGLESAKAGSRARLTFAGTLCLSLTGCVAANMYTIPDTLPKGAVQIVLAPEAWRLDQVLGPVSNGTFASRRYREDGVSAIPTGMVRIGVGDRVDLGIGLVRADVKVNVVRDGVLSVAVDPIFRLVRTQQGLGEVAELPVLAGARIARGVTIVGNGGLSLLHIQTRNYDPGSGQEFTLQAAIRCGLGIRLQFGSALGLQPEVTYMRAFAGPEASWVSGGIGIVLGDPL